MSLLTEDERSWEQVPAETLILSVAPRLLGPGYMAAPERRTRRFIPIWLLLSLAVLAAGLYFGYRWPEITATIVLLALVAIWMGAERLTTRWWY